MKAGDVFLPVCLLIVFTLIVVKLLAPPNLVEELRRHREFRSYKGPSLETYPVDVDIGQAHFTFPRNFIDGAWTASGWNELDDPSSSTVSLVRDVSGPWGLTPATADFSTAMPGSVKAPTMMTAQISARAPSESEGRRYTELLKQPPAVQECGLDGYRLGNTVTFETPTNVDTPALITCFDPNGGDGACDLRFDSQADVGVRIRFNRAQLCQWPTIKQSVQTVLTSHTRR